MPQVVGFLPHGSMGRSVLPAPVHAQATAGVWGGYQSVSLSQINGEKYDGISKESFPDILFSKAFCAKINVRASFQS